MWRRILKNRRRGRVFLISLLAYATFYLSGIKPEPAPTPFYSYSLSTGDGEVGWDPISLWKQSSLAELVMPPAYRPTETREIANQKATGLAAVAFSGFYLPAAAENLSRQVVRTATVHLLVNNPAELAAKLGALANRLQGYVVSSNVATGRAGEHGAVVTFRVPVSKLDDALAELRSIAIIVESQRTDSNDFTKDFVDKESTLRNYRAEEAQYLTIMKGATAVKDVLDVSEKLGGVRGRIEKLQGELQYLSQQVEMSSITVYLDAESQAQVFGLHWRPLYRTKIAAREGLDALGNYFGLVVALILRLPVILLWVITLFVLAAAGWRLFKRMAKLFFPAKAVPPQLDPNVSHH